MRPSAGKEGTVRPFSDFDLNPRLDSGLGLLFCAGGLRKEEGEWEESAGPDAPHAADEVDPLFSFFIALESHTKVYAP